MKRYLYLLSLMVYIVIYGVNNIVYVDESGVNKHFSRRRYRSKRGLKLHFEKPGRRFKRTNVIAGLQGKKHVAVRCYTHATNAVFFNDWFEWELLPAIPEFSLVIMDNASFHKKEQLYRTAAKHNIFLLFLPPYSPDFNPIEKSWANLKFWLIDNFLHFQSIAHVIEFYFLRLRLLF